MFFKFKERIDIDINALRRRLFYLSTFRLFLLLVLILATLFVTRGTTFGFLLNVRIFLLWVGIIFSLITIVFIPILYSSQKAVLILLSCYIQMFIDVLLSGCIIIVTGGTGSIFTFFFSLVIIISSILISWKGAIVFAFLSTLIIVIIGLSEVKIIPAPYIIKEFLIFTSFSSVLYNIVVNSVAFFLIAFLASYLTEKLRKIDILKRNMEKRIKEDEKLTIIGRLASVVAHEIRNPLASISGAIQLLSQTYNFDEEDKRLVNIILKEIEHLNNWINDLLGFARPVRGKIVNFNLQNLIKNVVNVVKNDEKFKNIEIKNFSEESNLTVRGDDNRLRIVFMNILKNSAEAMQGRGEISIFVENFKDGKRKYIKVSINDKGPGIEIENIERVFEPFWTTKERGTGLGLSTAKQIIDEHEGKIEIRNISEGGCGVDVYLPV